MRVLTTAFVSMLASGCAAGEAYGWFVADQPTASGPYTSATSLTSEGGTNRATRLWTGTYRLEFPLLGGVDGGNLQVTALGPGPAYCKAVDWSQVGDDVVANVACFDAGTPADSAFVASYEATNPASPAHAYAWYVPPSPPATSSAVPPRAGYAANVSSIYTPTGHVTLSVSSVTALPLENITAAGPGSEHCISTTTGISCFDPSGTRVAGGFSFIKGMGRVAAGSLGDIWAAFAKFDVPLPSAVHTPQVQGSTLSARAITVTRTALGLYTVNVPDAARPSPLPLIVHVSGHDILSPQGIPVYCKLAGWRNAPAPDQSLLVDVACFRLETGAATPEDHGFWFSLLMYEPRGVVPP